ncbi:Putative HTH-type transcriptional regulator [Acidilobus saccharovorans 345-15]|uniref:Putative HTH-type transcriptional regulator n=1 Tax=Acidilobus saccharovorans (strain DSM 16705 / JCM 18335 / VKM B-2471 / 345-15) TaxID=666510 RepID=D9Q0W1_ACIS3|nr:helix-turn-helix domain-containing protein [Acidilobus saccharovorans]ADL18949.1 Putative HTH-type transcriptional regulator [Acidilobus saccharovorans 345-15]
MEELEEFAYKAVAVRIAGDIVLSDSPGAALRKWREYFKLSQQEVAKYMGVSSSVLSDYEKGRRSPGAGFIRRFVTALLKVDAEKGTKRSENLVKALGIPTTGIIDMQEFSEPMTLEDIIITVDGILLYPDYPKGIVAYGYTVIDSIKAITELTSMQFYTMLGSVPERVIVFTKVTAGRSPMVAVRVSLVKPSIIVIHGPREHVDYLSIELARLDRIPLVLSTLNSVDELVQRLRSRTGGRGFTIP